MLQHMLPVLRERGVAIRAHGAGRGGAELSLVQMGKLHDLLHVWCVALQTHLTAVEVEVV